MQPLGKTILGNLYQPRLCNRHWMTIKSKAFKVKSKRFAEISPHLFKGMARAGTAGNVGRKAA